MKISFFLGLWVLIFNFLGCYSSYPWVPRPGLNAFQSSAGELSIGYWMLDRDLQVAHWLGQTWHGEKIIEPINVIFLIQADHPLVANHILMQVLFQSGFVGGFFHSSHYQAFINHQLVQQAPWFALTFSDNSTLLDNHHLRMMGPEKVHISSQFLEKFFPFYSQKTPQKIYVYVGSCSEEGSAFSHPPHHFVSFQSCQNDLAKKLKRQGIPTHPYFLGNIYHQNSISTQDYQGYALLALLH